MLTKGMYPEKSKGNNDFEKQFIHRDKIKEEIKELDNMKIDGEVFITARNFAKKILEELLED